MAFPETFAGARTTTRSSPPSCVGQKICGGRAMPEGNNVKPSNPHERVYGVGRRLIGKDYATHDLYAKVTGQEKYAEDYHAERMLCCKLLLSPLPHARVKHL